MIKSIDELMFNVDNNNPYRHNLIYGYGGLGYKPTKYNMVGGELYDGDSDSDSDGEYSDMAESLLIDNINDLNDRFDTLKIDELKLMKNYQNQLEDVINEKPNKDDDDIHILNEIEQSRNLINKILYDIDNKNRLIYDYDIKRGIKKYNEYDNLDEYLDDEEEDVNLKDYITIYNHLINKPVLTIQEKKLLEYIKKKMRVNRLMIGGMAYPDADNPNEMFDEHILSIKEKYPDLNIKTLDEYLEAVIQSELINEDRKISELNKQLSDLEFEKEINDAKGKNKNYELDKNIDKSLNIINKYFEKDEKREIKALEKPYYQPETNEFYDRNEKEAENEYPSKTKIGIKEKNTERGDIFENDAIVYDDETQLLYNIDKDKTIPYDTKELEPYTKEFLEYSLKKIGIDKNLNDITEDDMDNLRDKVLKYIPIDVVKDNTLWELKSFGEKIKNYGKYGLQSLSTTKMDTSPIFKNKNEPYFNVSFKYNKVGDEWRVKNIFTDNGIPLFKNNNFKYYWMFNNPDGIGYYNPLTNKNFEPIEEKKNKKNSYYKFGWKDKDAISANKIKIYNYDIQLYPRRYSTKFNKIIKKYKNK